MGQLYKHNVKGDYCRFGSVSGVLHNFPFIVEFVFNDAPSETKVWNNIKLDVKSSKYNQEHDEFYNNEFGFFTDIITYNTKQCSGKNTIKLIGATDTSSFFDEQLEDVSATVSAIKKEGNWLINGFRNNVNDISIPFFSKDWNAVKDEFPIDKVINIDAIDFSNVWEKSEMFRGKHLIVRLIDDQDDYTKQLTINIADDRTMESRR